MGSHALEFCKVHRSRANLIDQNPKSDKECHYDILLRIFSARDTTALNGHWKAFTFFGLQTSLCAFEDPFSQIQCKDSTFTSVLPCASWQVIIFIFQIRCDEARFFPPTIGFLGRI